MKGDRFIIVVVFFFTSLLSADVIAQFPFLLEYSHKTAHSEDRFYFYVEKDISLQDSSSFSVKFLRFFDAFPADFVGCCLYGDQLTGELAVFEKKVNDSTILKFTNKAEVIYNEALVKNRDYCKFRVGKTDEVRIFNTEFKYCSCKVYKEPFSNKYDTLIMPTEFVRKVKITKEHKKVYERCFLKVIDTEYVKSCLPTRSIQQVEQRKSELR